MLALRILICVCCAQDRVLAGQRPELPEWTPAELQKLIRASVEADPAKRPGQNLVPLLKALPHGTWREPPNANPQH